jgi:putative hydrolase of the HAD superfamily
MKRAIPITTLFLDNGWDHHARERAATNFKLELVEMEDRHHLTFDTYEVRNILHTDYRSTCAKLASFGLQNDEGVIHEAG